MAQSSSQYKVLDGGMSTMLISIVGQAEFDADPLWGSGLIRTNPDAVIKAHESFLDAGSDIIETATYQSSVTDVMKCYKVSQREAQQFFNDAVKLCRKAVENHLNKTNCSTRDIHQVAGSIGPYGAHLGNCSEYTGEYADNLTIQELKDWHRPQVMALLDAGVDMLAFETIPAQKEAEAIVELLNELPSCPAWISFSCKDGERVCHGELLSEASRCVLSCKSCVGVGVNCTSPRYVVPLIESLRGGGGVGGRNVVVYPNSGEIYNTDKSWSGSRDTPLEQAVVDWVGAGASWVGGCCRVTSSQISDIRKTIDKLALTTDPDLNK